MTSLRKWRFPILIGLGLIAAVGLVYFSSSHVSSDKTQGAIGKRDVYRDAQVASADVATQGSAPVANQAILESSEFKSLAKDPAFQALLANPAFADLVRDKGFVALLLDVRFQQLVQRHDFAELVNSDLFRQALRRSNEQEMIHFLSSDTHANAAYAELYRLSTFNELLKNRAFRELAANQHFQELLRSNELRWSLHETAFVALLSRSDFQDILVNRSQAPTGDDHGATR